MAKKDQLEERLRPEEEGPLRAAQAARDAAEPAGPSGVRKRYEAAAERHEAQLRAERKAEEESRERQLEAMELIEFEAERHRLATQHVLLRNRAVAREGHATAIEDVAHRLQAMRERGNPNLEADVEQVRRGLAPLLDPGNPLSREEREAQAVEKL